MLWRVSAGGTLTYTAQTPHEGTKLPERSHGLQSWIDRLNQAELPALAAVVQDLQRLAQQDSASVQQLADVLLRDAALTSKVLRVGNSVYYNPSQESIKTISRAIVLIGFDNVRLIGLSVSLIDGLLTRAPREQLQELLARSFHAAVQARNIAGYVLSKRAEEVLPPCFITWASWHSGAVAASRQTSWLRLWRNPGWKPMRWCARCSAPASASSPRVW